MLFLSETMSMRGLIGCGLMLAGMILSQVNFGTFGKKIKNLSWSASNFLKKTVFEEKASI